MSRLPTFFPGLGGIGGAAGLLPTFPPRLNNVTNRWNPEGYNSDGDHFVLPTAPSGNLVYNNAASVAQYTITPSSINALADNWLSFNLDSVDNLLYVTAFDESTDVIYLASVTSAGTIVNIGNATASTNLTSSIHGWGGNANNAQGANMWRDTQGAGNFNLVSNQLILEINSSTGAIITETAVANLNAGCYLSTDNIYFQPRSTIRSGTAVFDAFQPLFFYRFLPSVTNAVSILIADGPQNLGLPSITNGSGEHRFTALRWKGFVFWTVAVINFVDRGQPKYMVDELDTAVNTAAENFRFSS